MGSQPPLRGPDESPSYHERIWTNWKQGQGACEGCPNRDCGEYWKPSYGGGSIPSEIAVVGETPNAKWRYEKDSPKEGEKVDSHAEFGYWEQLDTSYHMFSQFLTPIINERVEGYSLNDIYYTNLKKCADIKVGDQDSDSTEYNKSDANSEAMDACTQYIKEELDLVNPTVIVAMKDAMDELNNIYQKFPENKSDVSDLALNIYGQEPPYIIPSYHWAALHFTYNNPDGFDIDSKTEYWEILSEQIEECLTRR